MYQRIGSSSLSESDQLARLQQRRSSFSNTVDSKASDITEPKLIMHTDTPFQESTSHKIKRKAGSETGGFDATDAVPTRSERNLTKEKLEPPVILNGNGKPNQNDLHSTTQQNDSCHLYYLTFLALFEWSTICTKFSILDLLSSAVSMGLYVFDVVTDILNAISYYYRQHENENNLVYFYFTTVLIVVPSLISQAFSYWWERDDQTEIKRQRERSKPNACHRLLISLAHILQIATLFRYARVVYYGLKSRKEGQRTNKCNVEFYEHKWRYEHSDLSLVRLFDSFLEAAPQLVLQIYIMVTTKQTPFITVVSCVGSWAGLSYAFLSIQRSLRHSQEGKIQISILGSIVLIFYRACTVLSRVFALALLLDIHIWAWLGLFVIHWFMMTVWIVVQGTNFCPSRGKEVLYDIVVGFCYNFAYVNVHHNNKEDRKCFINNKRRLIFFYVIVFVENCVLAGLWLKYRQGGGSLINALMGHTSEGLVDEEPTSVPGLSPDIALGIVILIPAVFLLGMLFMIVYYVFLHPSVKGSGCTGTEVSETSSPDPIDPPTNVVQESGEDRSRIESQQRAPGLQRRSSVPLDEVVVAVRNARLSSEIIQGTCEAEREPLIDQHETSPIERTAAHRSCYSLRHESESCQPITPKAKSLSFRSQPSRDPTAERAVSYNRTQGATILTGKRRVEEIDKDLEEKLVKRKEIEKELKLNLSYAEGSAQRPQSPQSPIENMFNRKERARKLFHVKAQLDDNGRSGLNSHSGEPQRTFSATPRLESTSVVDETVRTVAPTSDRPSPHHTNKQSAITHPLSPLALSSNRDPTYAAQNFSQSSVDRKSLQRKRLYSAGETGSNLESNCNVNSTRSGTFPRCSKKSEVSTPRSLRVQALNPISENASTLPTSSASLSDLSTRFRGTRKFETVPRATSFTINKNEMIVSIESTI